MKQYTYSKSERLKSRKQIQTLFKKGKSITQYPVRVVFYFVPQQSNINCLAGFSVSKKHFSNAVDRNRIKRQMREAYRLQKPHLVANIPEQLQLQLMFIYIGRQKSSSIKIGSQLNLIIKQLSKHAFEVNVN